MRSPGLARSASLLVALAACGDDGAPPVDAAPPTGPARVQVVRYDYELDLETRASASTLTLRLTEPGDCVTLAQRNPTLQAGSVTLDGQPARVTTTATTLTACGVGWPAGTEVTLAARMSQNLGTVSGSQVGYSVATDGLGNSLWYLISWVGGCDRFGPCDPTPATFAHYKFTVRHRAGVRALCPGRVTPGELVTTCEFDLPGGPTYSTFGLIATPSWTETSLGTWGGVQAKLFDRPGSGIGPLIDPAYHQGFLAWMTARFGPYPYGDELRIVVAPTFWAGFEHPGNIVLDDGLDRPMSSLYLKPVAHVLKHEIAHMWAGDQTTLADTYDFVWKEAMAEYLAFLYEAEADPTAAAITAAAWKSFARGARYHPVPEERPELFSYYGEVYGPGPMVLFRQLEAMTSRQKVVDAIKLLLGRERAISVADVQAALEATTGLDLDRYFDIWVVGTGAPAWATFQVTIGREAPVQHIRLMETSAVLHPCDFNVELRGANPDERTKIRFVRGLTPEREMNIDTLVPWNVTSTVIDPDSECLAYPAALTAPPLHPPGWSPWRTAR